MSAESRRVRTPPARVSSEVRPSRVPHRRYHNSCPAAVAVYALATCLDRVEPVGRSAVRVALLRRFPPARFRERRRHRGAWLSRAFRNHRIGFSYRLLRRGPCPTPSGLWSSIRPLLFCFSPRMPASRSKQQHRRVSAPPARGWRRSLMRHHIDIQT